MFNIFAAIIHYRFLSLLMAASKHIMVGQQIIIEQSYTNKWALRDDIQLHFMVTGYRYNRIFICHDYISKKNHFEIFKCSNCECWINSMYLFMDNFKIPRLSALGRNENTYISMLDLYNNIIRNLYNNNNPKQLHFEKRGNFLTSFPPTKIQNLSNRQNQNVTSFFI